MQFIKALHRILAETSWNSVAKSNCLLTASDLIFQKLLFVFSSINSIYTLFPHLAIFSKIPLHSFGLKLPIFRLTWTFDFYVP